MQFRRGKERLAEIDSEAKEVVYMATKRYILWAVAAVAAAGFVHLFIKALGLTVTFG